MSAWVTTAQVLAAGGIGGFFTEIVRGVSTRRKFRAEAARQGVDANVALSNAAMSLLEPAREQIAFLHAELVAARSEGHQLRAEGQQLRDEVQELRAQVSSLNASLREAHANLAVLQQGMA